LWNSHFLLWNPLGNEEKKMKTWGFNIGLFVFVLIVILIQRSLHASYGVMLLTVGAFYAANVLGFLEGLMKKYK
jgi:hypothetical protein